MHALLARHLPPRAEVLDLGSGVGTDAAWLTARGHRVTLLDDSPGMLAAARARVPGAEALAGSAEAVARLADGRTFDAALLDFGVANAVDLRRTAAGLARVVRPGGVVVVVSMPRVPVAWLLAAALGGRWAQLRARLGRSADVPVAGRAIPTRYRDSVDVAADFAPWFSVRAVAGLGVALPPPGSRRDPARVARAAPVDRALGALPLLRDLGDHVAVVLRRRPAAWRPPPLRRRAHRARVDRAAREGRVTLHTLILEVTAGCQSRCVGCGHRGPAGGEALTPARAGELADEAREAGARDALITGGEPLLRRDAPALLEAVADAGLAVTLLTNGLALRRHAAVVARTCAAVVLSLDGHDRETYAATRGVDGLGAVAGGVAALRARAPRLPITARVTVTAGNVAHLRGIVDRARALGLDGVSLLAADTETAGALGRDAAIELAPVAPAALVAELAALRAGPWRRFVVDSDAALDRLLHRARAAAGLEPPRPPSCDAPFTTALVTPDLGLRPCFFLPADGSVADGLGAGLRAARPARAALDLSTNPTCARCVCWARLA